jgi:hypothetical protein
MYIKEVAPIQVRDLTHLYCTDHDCNANRKCQCLQTGLKCKELCVCRGDTCHNTLLDDESDTDDYDADADDDQAN